jgi:WD40 repeat protein
VCLPSSEIASAATRPPSSRRRDSFIVFASRTITRPSASPVPAVAPSFDLGRCVGSLTFKPDGKFLAEGPTPRENIQIRDVETRKVVQTLANGTKRSMNVRRMAYTQGGRVLIACDNITNVKEIAVPHRINLWDTASGSIAHQIALPAGVPYSIDVSPNGRYLAAMLDDGDSGMKLSVWRLDGEKPVTEPEPGPPAADRER